MLKSPSLFFFTCCADVSSRTWQEENRRIVAATPDKQSSGKCKIVHERLRSQCLRRPARMIQKQTIKKSKIRGLAAGIRCIALS